MKITILGWYGHGNTGDEAYKVSFPALFPGHDLHFTDSIEDGHGADLVVLGGGDVLYPGFTRQLKRLPGTPRWLLSATLTPQSDLGVLESFDRVCVRDRRSLAYSDRAGYLPDATFAIEADGREAGRDRLRERFRRAGHECRDRVVAVVISSYLMHNHLDAYGRDLTTFLKFSQDVAAVADAFEDTSFVFVPFCTMAPHDDRTANAWTASRCRDYLKNLVLWDGPSVHATLDFLVAADAVVSSRLHASIFATIGGTPFVDVTHHDKNLGYVETLGKTEWSIPFWDFDARRYRDLLRHFLDDASSERADLATFTESSREALGDAALL